MDTMNICLASDKNYLQHLLVTMASVLLHADSSDRFHFIILSDGSLNCASINRLKKIRDFDFELINAASLVDQYMEVSPDCHWSVAVYYRLLLPFICPELQRIIYLDCDIIVRTSLTPLWMLPMKEKSFAGVSDSGFSHKDRLKKHGVVTKNEYLNSGVAVLNLDRIRSGNYAGKLEAAKKQIAVPEFPDQDWMNIMFDDEKLVLPVKWNVMSHLFSEELQGSCATPEIECAKQHPCICHFTNIKPWTMTYNEHPYWFEYWEVLKHTPFAWCYPAGFLKKMFLSKNDTLLFRHIRPAVKQLLGRNG